MKAFICRFEPDFYFIDKSIQNQFQAEFGANTAARMALWEVERLFVINNVEWDIAFVNPSSNKLRRSDGSITCGVCDFGDKRIYISNALRGGFLRKVYIHEVCHAAIFSYGINLSLPQEEFLCDFIATYGDEIFTIVDDLFMALKRIA